MDRSLDNVERVGAEWVRRNPDGTLRAIGDRMVSYRPDGSIRTVGDDVVRYHPDGRVREIGGERVDYSVDGTIRAIGGETVRNRPGGAPTARSALESLASGMGQRRPHDGGLSRDELERRLEADRRRLRAILPKAPAGLARKVRHLIGEMVAVRLGSGEEDPAALGRARGMLGLLADGLREDDVDDMFLKGMPAACGRARGKVEDARFFCMEGDVLDMFCTILAGDILLGGDGTGSRLDPRQFLGEIFPMDVL